MAGSRRGRSKSGFPGAELRGTLGTLFRSALGQAGVVRTALERGAREGRARLDDARMERQRADALAELGEAVLAAVRRGDLVDLEDLPEIAHAVAALDDLDARLEDHHDERRRRDRHAEVSGHPDVITPARRASSSRGEAPWQRVRDDDDVEDAQVEEPRRRGGSSGGDGTVSSSSWTPPRPAAPQRVWRPPADVPDAPEETAVERPSRRRASEPRPETRASEPRPETRPPEAKAEARPAPRARRPAPRAGGISFASEDDDEAADLREYMHPDDVPAKPERKPERK